MFKKITLSRAESDSSREQRWADDHGRWWLVKNSCFWRLYHMPSGLDAQAMDLSAVLDYAREEHKTIIKVDNHGETL